MRGNTFFKRGFHQEGGYKGGFTGGPGNPGGFRGGYQGSGYRKFSNMSNTETNSNEKPVSHTSNNKVNGNDEHHEPANIERTAAIGPTTEEPFLSEKKQQDNELRQMLKAHLLPGGLKSLIQNQSTINVGGLRDEERESLRLEEVAEPTQHDTSRKFEILAENKPELPVVQPIMPVPPTLTLDKGIFTEHRIKRKDPNAGHGGNPGEGAIKKVHME